MKKIAYGFVVAAALFGGAAFALADTDPLPYTFTCSPYTAPFVAGEAYIPADGGLCTYTLPLDPNAFVKQMEIYKGVVGNAQLVNVNLAIGDPSETQTISQNPFASFNPQPGDNFFAAAYTTSDGVSSPYLSSGTGTPPSDLQVLNWHWGAPLTVTADTQSVVAGSPLPTLTYTLSGFINGQTLGTSDITGAASCTTTATATSPAGNYAVTCSAGTLASGIYAANTFVPGVLHITTPPPPPPSDTTAPAVVITSPINGHAYLTTDTVTPAATATDASPIASTVYKFNGSVINSAVPLTLSGAPATSTLVVAATDSFGNTGYATSTFTVKTPPPPSPPADTTPPSITITSPVNDGLYAKTDTTVHVTATVTDASGVAATTYWFNGVKINPANALALTNAPVVSKVSVAATDTHGNTATSTVTIYVVKSVNSCLVDIVSVLTAITQDKTLPDKPTILNLIADCSALLKGLHHY